MFTSKPITVASFIAKEISTRGVLLQVPCVRGAERRPHAPTLETFTVAMMGPHSLPQG